MVERPESCHTVIESPIGPLTIAAAERGVTGIYMVNHSHPPAEATLGERLETAGANPFLAQAAQELGEYFAGTRTAFDVPLDPAGTDFQKRVWAELARIPFGQSRSYGELALELGDVNLTRAVGTANGHNPVSIIVPCHRVIGADGSLTGYAGGLERKLFLLRLEGIVPQAEETLF